MNIKNEYFEHGNHGIIEAVMCYPYNGAGHKELYYRVWIYDKENFLYHVSCHETLTGAKNTLEDCGFYNI